MHSFHSLAPLIAHLSHLSFGSVFLAMLASGHVIPIPEAGILILFGYIAAQGHASIPVVLGTSALVAFLMDIVVYGISFYGGELARRLSKKLDTSLVKRYEEAEERHLFFLVFASHFVPGWRFANPIICGVTEMPQKKFLLYTIISVCIYVPVLFTVGFVFHERILPLLVAVESFSQLALELCVVVLLFIIGILLSRRREGKRV